MLQIRSEPLTTPDEWYESIIYEGEILFYVSHWVLLNEENIICPCVKVWCAERMLCGKLKGVAAHS